MSDEQRQQDSVTGGFLSSAGVKPWGKARTADSFVSRKIAKSPMYPKKLMEEIVHAENVKRALARVEANEGSPGIDKMKVENLRPHLGTRRSQSTALDFVLGGQLIKR